MEEVVEEYDCVLVSEEVIFTAGRSFPWALDCLCELGSRGVWRLLLIAQDAVDLAALGLIRGEHFDAVEHGCCGEEHAISAGAASCGCRGRKLVVGGDVGAIRGAQAAGLDSALVCTGALSESFGLAAAPVIDVPADGGKFIEPDEDCWPVALCGAEPPTCAMACFAFSESFFFRYFAEKRARALRAHRSRGRGAGTAGVG